MRKLQASKGSWQVAEWVQSSGTGHTPSANSPRSRAPGKVSKAAERCRDHETTIIMVHGGHCRTERIIVHMRSWEPLWPRCCRPGALRRWHYRPHTHWPPPSAVASPRSRSRVCFLQTRCGGTKIHFWNLLNTFSREANFSNFFVVKKSRKWHV